MAIAAWHSCLLCDFPIIVHSVHFCPIAPSFSSLRSSFSKLDLDPICDVDTDQKNTCKCQKYNWYCPVVKKHELDGLVNIEMFFDLLKLFAVEILQISAICPCKIF